MTATRPKKILGGVFVMAVCVAVGMLLPMVAGDPVFTLSRLLLVLGVVAVAIPTFEWGATLGYRARDAGGKIHLEHFLRSAVMTVIIAAIGAFFGGVLFSVVFSALRS